MCGGNNGAWEPLFAETERERKRERAEPGSEEISPLFFRQLTKCLGATQRGPRVTQLTNETGFLCVDVMSSRHVNLSSQGKWNTLLLAFCLERQCYIHGCLQTFFGMVFYTIHSAFIDKQRQSRAGWDSSNKWTIVRKNSWILVLFNWSCAVQGCVKRMCGWESWKWNESTDSLHTRLCSLTLTLALTLSSLQTPAAKMGPTTIPALA